MGDGICNTIKLIMKKKIIENIYSVLIAVFLAILIRTFILQPFYIPSASMENTLLTGDRLFVTKYTYGYSRHSFPFSLKLFNDRIFFSKPDRGDVIVFKTPADNRTDYIKRLVGLPNDKIQFINGDLYVNNNKVEKKFVRNDYVFCGDEKVKVKIYSEKINPDIYYEISYFAGTSFSDTDQYIVPENHYFFLGDNRDCSSDSRYLSKVGYVNSNNLVGKARFIFFSNDKYIGSFFKFWKWNKSIRFNRILKKIN